MFLYLDTESTGLSRHDRIIEIAIVRDDGTIALSTLIDPKRPISPHAQKVHGISAHMLRGMPTWEEIEPEIIRLASGADLVAHNAPFDLRFTGRVKDVVGSVTCTLKLTRMKLAKAAAAIGYTPSGAYHRATADALACRAVHHAWLARQAAHNAPLTPHPVSSDSATQRNEMAPAQGSGTTEDPRLVRVDPALCSPASLRGKPWTAHADAELLALWRRGADLPEILTAIQRTPLAIFLRLEKLGAIPAGANPYAMAGSA